MKLGGGSWVCTKCGKKVGQIMMPCGKCLKRPEPGVSYDANVTWECGCPADYECETVGCPRAVVV